MKWKLHIFAIWFCVLACQPPYSNVSQDHQGNLMNKQEDSRNVTDLATGKLKSLMDPDKAAVTLNSLSATTLQGVASTEQDSFEFPKLEFEFTSANYIELLRCPVSKNAFYVFKDGSGSGKSVNFADFQKAVPWGDGNILTRTKYKDFWISAANTSLSGCVFVGYHIVRETVFDLAAPSGHWYYLANPCVSKVFSKTGLVGCGSNRIVASKPIQYVSKLSKEFNQVMEGVSKLESRVFQLLTDIENDASKLVLQMRACETKSAVEAHNETIHNAWRGFWGGAVGGVIGFIFGGWEGARRGFRLGVQLARENIDSMQRYVDKLSENCKHLQSYVDRMEASYKHIEKTAQEAQALGLKLTTINSQFDNFDGDIHENYVETYK